MNHAVFLSRATQERCGHGGELWQNVVHWRREWQTTSVFLPWEPQKQTIVTLLQIPKELSSFGTGVDFFFLQRLWKHSWHQTSWNISTFLDTDLRTRRTRPSTTHSEQTLPHQKASTSLSTNLIHQRTDTRSRRSYGPSGSRNKCTNKKLDKIRW